MTPFVFISIQCRPNASKLAIQSSAELSLLSYHAIKAPKRHQSPQCSIFQSLSRIDTSPTNTNWHTSLHTIQSRDLHHRLHILSSHHSIHPAVDLVAGSTFPVVEVHIQDLGRTLVLDRTQGLAEDHIGFHNSRWVEVPRRSHRREEIVRSTHGWHQEEELDMERVDRCDKLVAEGREDCSRRSLGEARPIKVSVPVLEAR
jgi:hypothetical protein